MNRVGIFHTKAEAKHFERRIFKLAKQLLAEAVISTKKYGTVLTGLQDKVFEGLQIIGFGGEEIRMVVFNISHQADSRLEPQEHVVVFIGFDRKQLALAFMRIG